MTDAWSRGDWMTTATGIRAYPADPERTEIRLYDIAHALGRICRFGGHVSVAHYSVAQHSILVSRIVPPPMALVGLMHDAAEAYIGDIVKPFKRALYTRGELYVEPIEVLEHRWWIRIADAFDMPYEMHPEIKLADMRALWTERRDVMAPNASVSLGHPLPEHIEPLSSIRATSAFLERYEEVKKT